MSDNTFNICKASMLTFDPRNQMAAIFADGFAQWLTYFTKDKAVLANAFSHMFVLEQFYVAVDGGRVAGMIGCTDGYTPSVCLNSKELMKHLGFIRGMLAVLFLKKEFEGGIANPRQEKSSIEFVGTVPEYRGQGVATKIFSHIYDNTPYTEYVIEEVADTNIPAISLYKKWGFVEYKSKTVPLNQAKKIGINSLVSFKYNKRV